VARLMPLMFRHPFALLLLQVAALWPVWRWYVARIGDGSDEPWGAAALILGLGLVWQQRGELRTHPRGGLLLSAGFLTLAQAAATDGLPALVRALIGMTGLGLALTAYLPKRRDGAAVWGLLILSLPLMSSLQFYAGYPLRILAATGSGLVLRAAGLPVFPEGAGLRWEDRLILVDAPCSGLHMLWVGLILSTALSVLVRASTARLTANWLLAAALILLGNVLRNSLLFVKESGILALPDWTHAGIGVLVFVLTLLPLTLLILRRYDAR
jgi:exosortase/archaeosortase family protein